MITGNEDLVSLEEIQSVLTAYAGPATPRTRPASRRIRRFRSLAVVTALVTALALVGVAVADGLGVFSGINAAQHPQTGADVIDPQTAAWMQGHDCNTGPAPSAPVCMPAIAGLLLNTARRVGQLPSGQKVYVITSADNKLCFVVAPPHPEWNCDDPLSNTNPTTVATYATTSDPGQWTTFGVALDGVTSVSFQAGGQEVTVPVEANLWTYQGENLATSSLTVHFADGSTYVLSH